MLFHFKDILQHFKFVNSWIGEFMVSFFDVTNRLISRTFMLRLTFDIRKTFLLPVEWKGRNLGIALIFSLSSSKETVGSSSCTFWFSFSVDSWDSLDRNPESLDVVAWTSTLVLISEVIHYGVLATKPLEFDCLFVCNRGDVY